MAAASSQAPGDAGTLARLAGEIGGLRTDVQALTGGLHILLDVVRTHGDLLRELGEALRQEPADGNPVAEALAALGTAVRDQGAAIERLSGHIAGAVLRGVGADAGG